MYKCVETICCKENVHEEILLKDAERSYFCTRKLMSFRKLAVESKP